MPREKPDFRIPDVEKLLGARAGACHKGWHHPWDPDGCELDNVVEEELLDKHTVHQEELEHMRAHAHRGVPSKHDLLRAHAAGEPHPLHGQALKPITTTNTKRKGA